MRPGVWLAVSALAGLSSVVLAKSRPRLWLWAIVIGCGSALGASGWALATGEQWGLRGGLALGGEVVHLRLDGLSALFLALVGVVGLAGAVYSAEYWRDADHPVSAWRGRAWWSVLLGAMGVLLLCSNGLHFLVAWEAFALAGYFLITLDGRRREVRSAGWLYLAASHAGTVALFGFFAGLAAGRGSWELGPMRGEPGLAGWYWLALVGFGLKAGLFPLHIWLPSAHANAPSHVSAILSGVAIKMGVYGIIRFGGWLAVPESAGWVVLGLGVVSAVLGVVFALGQHDLKRLLAYHSVENIGIILIGAGFAMVAVVRGEVGWGVLVLAGGLLHVWNHGLFKSLLFLGAGAVVHATGTRQMSRLGGLWVRMPWTTGMFAMGAVAIAGLPPLNGFVSEWLLYVGLFEAVNQRGSMVWGAIPAVVLLGMTGALALACFVKVCGVVFLGSPRSVEAQRAHECGVGMRGAMGWLGLGCVGIGLVPVMAWPALRSAVGAWQGEWLELGGPGSLVVLGRVHVMLAVLGVLGSVGLWRWSRRAGWVRGPTWDCGYAAPTARMQYTAGSFASIICGWFAWVLRPVKHVVRPEGAFPREGLVDVHTPEVVLERVIGPWARWVMWISGWVRRLQHGRVQAYLAYVLFGLLLVAWVTLAWSSR